MYQIASKVNKIDDIEGIQAAWKRYECIFGNSDQIGFNAAKLTTDAEAYEWKMRIAAGGNQLPGKHQKNWSHRPKSSANERNRMPRRPSRLSGKEKHEKRKRRRARKQQNPNPSSQDELDRRSVRMSNLPYNATTSDIYLIFPDLKIQSITLNIRRRRLAFALVVLEDEANVRKAVAFDRRRMNQRPIFITEILHNRIDRIARREYYRLTRVLVTGVPRDTSRIVFKRKFDYFVGIVDFTMIENR